MAGLPTEALAAVVAFSEDWAPWLVACRATRTSTSPSISLQFTRFVDWAEWPRGLRARHLERFGRVQRWRLEACGLFVEDLDFGSPGFPVGMRFQFVHPWRCRRCGEAGTTFDRGSRVIVRHRGVRVECAKERDRLRVS